MNFLENLRRAKEAKRQPLPLEPKDPEQMTDAEREEEIKRLEWEAEPGGGGIGYGTL